MNWQTAALISAVGFAVKGFSTKAACRAAGEFSGRSFELGLMAWTTLFSAILMAAVRILLPAPIALQDPASFSKILLLCVFGAVLANFCYFKAIRHAPLSIAMPIFSLSPVFMILTSRWMLGETASAAGMAGIFSTAAGVAILYGGQEGSEIERTRFRSGFLYAVSTALIWSVTANLDKRAVSLSDPFLYPAVVQFLLSIVYFAAIPRISPGILSGVVRNASVLKWVALASVSDVIVLGSQMTAILQTHVAYVIAIKRSGAILAVILGWRVFGERQVLRRIAGCLLIVAGVAVLLVM